MNVNPDEYDPAELRRMAAKRVPGEAPTETNRRHDGFALDRIERRRRDESLRSTQLEELFMHQTAGGGRTLTKPYLAAIPDDYAAERVVFDWLEFLVLKTGFKRSFEALRFYQSIDWITPTVEDELQEYLLGFTEEGEHAEELAVEDHHLSLVYLAKLAALS